VPQVTVSSLSLQDNTVFATQVSAYVGVVQTLCFPCSYDFTHYDVLLHPAAGCGDAVESCQLSVGRPTCSAQRWRWNGAPRQL